MTLIPVSAERCTQKSADPLNILNLILERFLKEDDIPQGEDVCRCPP